MADRQIKVKRARLRHKEDGEVSVPAYNSLQVLDELPKEQQPQVLSLLRAAWRVSNAGEGIKRLDQLARFLEHEYESAARSLREGMTETFTVQRCSFRLHSINVWAPRI